MPLTVLLPVAKRGPTGGPDWPATGPDRRASLFSLEPSCLEGESSCVMSFTLSVFVIYGSIQSVIYVTSVLSWSSFMCVGIALLLASLMFILKRVNSINQPPLYSVMWSNVLLIYTDQKALSVWPIVHIQIFSDFFTDLQSK